MLVPGTSGLEHLCAWQHRIATCRGPERAESAAGSIANQNIELAPAVGYLLKHLPNIVLLGYIRRDHQHFASNLGLLWQPELLQTHW